MVGNGLGLSDNGLRGHLEGPDCLPVDIEVDMI
jgi:hypothetical protein